MKTEEWSSVSSRKSYLALFKICWSWTIILWSLILLSDGKTRLDSFEGQVAMVTVKDQICTALLPKTEMLQTQHLTQGLMHVLVANETLLRNKKITIEREIKRKIKYIKRICLIPLNWWAPLLYPLPFPHKITKFKPPQSTPALPVLLSIAKRHKIIHKINGEKNILLVISVNAVQSCYHSFLRQLIVHILLEVVEGLGFTVHGFELFWSTTFNHVPNCDRDENNVKT